MRERGAVGVAQRHVGGARARGGLQAAQRVGRVVGPAVEEVLGVVDDGLALAGEEGDRVLDHAQVLVAVDAHDLLEVQPPGLADERADGREGARQRAQRRVVRGRQVAPPRRPEGRHLAAQPLALEQREQLGLLGVRGREAGLDHVHAEVVEQVRDAQLLAHGQRHPLPLHAVAQGGVVDDDRAHVTARARARAPRRATRRSARSGPYSASSNSRCTTRVISPGSPGADRVVVDLADRGQLGGGARHEDLVGEVELAAGDVALDDLVAEVLGDLDRRQAVDAAEDRGLVARGGDDAVADHEQVLARALADVAVRVEQDALLVAGLLGLDLGEHGVEVLAGRLGGRDLRVVRDLPPRGDLRADAVLLALLAEVGGPLPDRDADVDRAVERVQAHRAGAAEDERADVAGLQARARDHLVRRGADLLLGVRDVHVVHPGRVEEPVDVVAVAEDRGAARGLVGAHALEHAGPVVQRVREHVHLRVLVGDELAVHPDEARFGHVISFRTAVGGLGGRRVSTQVRGSQAAVEGLVDCRF